MGWEYFCVVGFDRGPLLQGHMHLQYFFKYVLTYSLHLNSYLVTFLHNTICRAQLFCPFLLSGSELYPQTKVGDILDSGPSRRRRRRRRNFLVDAITQKQINIFFSNLVHMLRVPKGRSLF